MLFVCLFVGFFFHFIVSNSNWILPHSKNLLKQWIIHEHFNHHECLSHWIERITYIWESTFSSSNTIQLNRLIFTSRNYWSGLCIQIMHNSSVKWHLPIAWFQLHVPTLESGAQQKQYCLNVRIYAHLPTRTQTTDETRKM